MNVTHAVTLDFGSYEVNRTGITVKREDYNLHTLRFAYMENGEARDMTDADELRIRLVNAAGETKEAQIIGDTYTLGAWDVSVAGKLRGEVSIYGGGARLTSCDFDLRIVLGISVSGDECDDDRYPILDKAVMDAEEAAANASISAGVAGAAAGSAEGYAGSALAYKLEAAARASAAAASAAAASGSAGAASDSAAAAAGSASDAEDYKDAAAGSASDASDNATAAEDSADDARAAAGTILNIMGEANGVATLDGNGKLTPSQIPALSINDVFEVASTEAMLELTAQRGDVALIVDSGVVTDSYMLAADAPAVLANWKKLGVSYVANAGHAVAADTATNATMINSHRIVSMTESEYAAATKDADTIYFVTPDPEGV